LKDFQQVILHVSCTIEVCKEEKEVCEAYSFLSLCVPVSKGSSTQMGLFLNKVSFFGTAFPQRTLFNFVKKRESEIGKEIKPDGQSREIKVSIIQEKACEQLCQIFLVGALPLKIRIKVAVVPLYVNNVRTCFFLQVGENTFELQIKDEEQIEAVGAQSSTGIK
jgi:hypothetical protein